MSNTDGRHPATEGPADRHDEGPQYVHHAGFLLARLGAAAESEWGGFLARHAMTQSEFTLLTVLRENAPVRQGELASRAGVDRRNAVATIARLSANGLIDAVADPEDARAKRISLSGRGAEVLADLDAELAESRSRFFDPLTASEQRALTELLDRIYRARSVAVSSRRRRER